MEDLIKTLNLKLNEQTFVPLNKEKGEWLSIVLEHNHHDIDEDGKRFISVKPLGYKLNCAVQKPDEEMDFLTFYSEEEYYQFMIEYNKV